jgi:ATP phosphoribosyltransferase regulatory subunit
VILPAKAAARAEGARLLAHFRAWGAEEVEAAILQPAEALLDLYGEDIRARAYVTADPLRGELMLRPDFTVPLVEAHMRGGANPARYCYLGEVFRRQEEGSPRPNEFLQAGFEILGGADEADADAEAFAALASAVSDLPLRAVTGDVGLLAALVGGLSTTAPRRAALMRHLWRPRRFRALLDRFAGRAPAPPARPAPAPEAPEIGLRSRAEVEARLLALAEDAAAPPIPAAEVARIESLLALVAPLPEAIARLAAEDGLAAAADRLSRRARALARRGIDPAGLAFEGGFGRTALEYYDGFVWGLVAADPALPPVASGGRYDALTRRLGGGRALPAVGGVIRPEVVIELRGRG